VDNAENSPKRGDDQSMTQRSHVETVITSDADLHDLWRRLMGPGGFARRSLWLTFLEPDGRTQPLVVPIDDLPSEPDDGFLHAVGRIVDGLLADGTADSVPMLLSRPGYGPMTGADRRWARALIAALGPDRQRWPLHLATTDQVQVFAPDDLLT
jgi:hypothetical protein